MLCDHTYSYKWVFIINIISSQLAPQEKLLEKQLEADFMKLSHEAGKQTFGRLFQKSIPDYCLQSVQVLHTPLKPQYVYQKFLNLGYY